MFGLAFTLMLGSTLSFACNIHIYSIMEPSIGETLPSAAVAHSPVIINGNINSFTPKTGTGTSGDPFIIENLEISGLGYYSGSNYAFLLKDTPQYMIIRHITIKGIISSLHNIKLFSVVNCSHVTVEDISISDCELSTGTTGYFFYLLNSVNLDFKSIGVTNHSQNFVYAATIDNCNNSKFQDISFSDVDTATWGSWYFLRCKNINCKNLEIMDLHANSYWGFLLSINNNDIIIEDSTMDHIYTTSSITFYQSDATSRNCTIKRCSFLNSITGQINSNTLRGNNHGFIDNIVRNITTTASLSVLDVYNIANLNVSGNIIDSITSETSFVVCFNLYTDSEGNHISNNRVSNLNAPEDDSYNVYSRVGAISNRIWNNWFFSGSIPAFDDSDNLYSGLVYVPSLGVEITLGNYWYDHNYDEDQEFHYWVNTPRLIDGNGNLSDPRPIHYFMVDFDSDGLMNYDENEAHTDIWDSDSDDDGLSDGFEVDVLGTNPNLSDSDNDGISDGIDPEPLEPQFNFMDSLSEFVKEPLNDLLLGGVALLVVNMFLLFKRTETDKSIKKSNRNIEDVNEGSNFKLEPSKSQSKSPKKN